MNAQPERGAAETVLPSLLTVEEAAEVLRIGRTKAYSMTREWRSSGGESGLPVVDFGNVLRVPRHKLEELIGAPLTTGVLTGSSARGSTSSASDGESHPITRRTPRRKPGARPVHKKARGQLDLFDNGSSSDSRPS